MLSEPLGAGGGLHAPGPGRHLGYHRATTERRSRAAVPPPTGGRSAAFDHCRPASRSAPSAGSSHACRNRDQDTAAAGRKRSAPTRRIA